MQFSKIMKSIYKTSVEYTSQKFFIFKQTFCKVAIANTKVLS